MSNIKNHEQDKRIEEIYNHVNTMNKEFGEFRVSNSSEHSTLKTDLDWIKRTYWIIVTASIGGLVGSFIGVFKNLNN